jgi:hypothetical protein
MSFALLQLRPYVVIQCTAALELRARQRQAEAELLDDFRQMYGRNQEARAAGTLGEMAFNWWAKTERHFPGYEWRGAATLRAGDPDFIINTEEIDLKAKAAVVPPRDDFNCGVDAEAVASMAHWFAFASYDTTTRKMYLLGFMATARFRQVATFAPAGSPIGAPGGGLVSRSPAWCVKVGQLTRPMVWSNSDHTEWYAERDARDAELTALGRP